MFLILMRVTTRAINKTSSKSAILANKVKIIFIGPIICIAPKYTYIYAMSEGKKNAQQKSGS
jgi:hypothetical protein